MISRSLRKARRVISHADITIDILKLYGKVYQSSIYHVVNSIDKFNEDYKRLLEKKRSLESLIEKEEVDFESIESLTLEEN